MRMILSLILAFGLAFGLQAQVTKEVVPEKPKAEKPATEKPVKAVKNPMVVVHTNMGDITLEVLLKETPIHAKNFLDRVNKGLYDSVTFHRILDGFVIQGGDPTGTGMGEPNEPRLPDEKSPFSNIRTFVSMARSQAGASASQFFINLKDNSYLDKQNFSAFAKVVAGMDVVEKIAKVPVVNVPPNDPTAGRPISPVTMLKVYPKK